MSTDLVLTRSEAVEEQSSKKKWRMIPTEDLPAIAERYRQGEPLQNIAASYGVTDDAVRRRLEKWAVAGQGDAAHHDLVTEFLAEKALQAKDRIVDALDVVGVARAREETKFWQWILERRRPKSFGPKHHVEEDKRVRVVIDSLSERNPCVIPARALPGSPDDEGTAA
jgi:hypothetical protein